jgi:histone acetyltransferase (RNA polymerase elongator complex component)
MATFELQAVAEQLTPFVIPFFIAHQGCPHQCVFCNQHAISGNASGEVTAVQVAEEIAQKLAWPRSSGRMVQVAFYGGSFTGLALSQQEELLAAVAPYLAAGQVREIRISTRPDFVSLEIIDLLKSFGVSLVELGVQSLDDEVLQKSGRGHTVAQVEEAFALLKAGRMQIGGQLMVGLPGDTRRKAMQSAQKLAALKPDLVRLYPTLVMQGSPLAASFTKGLFRPWSLGLCTAVCSSMKDIFDRLGVTVARMGLQSCVSLEQDLVAGPYHPAFGELVLSRQYYKKLRAILFSAQKDARGQRFTLRLAERDRSLFAGMNKENMMRYQRRDLLNNVEVVFTPNQPRFSAEVS